MIIKKNVFKNIIMLYGFSIAKIVFPLITLPYLTRILSVDTYGNVAYVKTIMTYMQLIVDFGFMYSGTRDIVKAGGDKKLIGKETGNILLSRIILCGVSFIVLLVLMIFLPILRRNPLYTILSFGTVFCSVFLFDYLFRGLEKMHVITTRFMLMRGISTLFTFILVKNDSDILWIPVLDIIGSSISIVLVVFEIKKICIRITGFSFSEAIVKLKDSAIYFASDMATTAFGALNTVIIGALLSSSDVAYWSICMQLVAAVQAMYTPITNGVYPEMVKSKNLNQIYKLLKIFMPIILAGSIFTFFAANIILRIIGGSQYVQAAVLLRCLIPIFIFSFPGMLFGWPTLGSINKAKQVTISTVISAVSQVAGLVLLIVLNCFFLIPIAVVRCLTELVLMTIRMIYCYKYRDEFQMT